MVPPPRPPASQRVAPWAAATSGSGPWLCRTGSPLRRGCGPVAGSPSPAREPKTRCMFPRRAVAAQGAVLPTSVSCPKLSASRPGHGLGVLHTFVHQAGFLSQVHHVPLGLGVFLPLMNVYEPLPQGHCLSSVAPHLTPISQDSLDLASGPLLLTPTAPARSAHTDKAMAVWPHLLWLHLASATVPGPPDGQLSAPSLQPPGGCTCVILRAAGTLHLRSGCGAEDEQGQPSW